VAQVAEQVLVDGARAVGQVQLDKPSTREEKSPDILDGIFSFAPSTRSPFPRATTATRTEARPKFDPKVLQVSQAIT
jgi:hypothetical protein